ncbi:MAG TPA: glycosyltransferase [Chloroflexia bacterium]|nr:glycosyltransferase [Chloroflexia bacterium]
MNTVLQAIRTVDARQTGGAEELVLLLAPGLEARGRFRSPILLLRKPEPDADPNKDFGSRARRLGLTVVPLQEFTLKGGWLRQLPKRMGVQIVHVHGQRANYFVWIMRRLYPRAWGRVKLVATVHGWVQDNFVRKAVTWLEWRTLRECDHVITVSALQRTTLLSMGFSPDKVSVVRPGIPYLAESGLRTPTPQDRVQARAKWSLPPDAFVVSAIGRLSTEKRFDLYLEACALLSERIPEARFLLVGGGKQEANLRAQASSLGLAGRLTFTGLTGDMRSIYAATDLVMLTSDTEGTPHVLLEAMGSDIPVVATSVGGIPEFITSEEHGLLVPKGDKEALASAAQRLHDDSELRAKLVAGGRNVAAQFTVDHMLEGVETVYERVLDH